MILLARLSPLNNAGSSLRVPSLSLIKHTFLKKNLLDLNLKLYTEKLS